jgi:hypothetical protein
VSGRGHDDAGISGGESRTDKAGERIQQKIVRFVKLYEVLFSRTHCAPIRDGRELRDCAAFVGVARNRLRHIFHFDQKSLPANQWLMCAKIATPNIDARTVWKLPQRKHWMNCRRACWPLEITGALPDFIRSLLLRSSPNSVKHDGQGMSAHTF